MSESERAFLIAARRYIEACRAFEATPCQAEAGISPAERDRRQDVYFAVERAWYAFDAAYDALGPDRPTQDAQLKG